MEMKLFFWSTLDVLGAVEFSTKVFGRDLLSIGVCFCLIPVILKGDLL